MAKSKKNKNKSKLNLTVREEQRNKLERTASAACPRDGADSALALGNGEFD
jgi:hypothetical protein